MLSRVYCKVSALYFFYCSYNLENPLNTKLFVSERMFIDLCMTLTSNCEDVYREKVRANEYLMSYWKRARNRAEVTPPVKIILH